MKTEIINLLQTTQAFNGGNQGINARDVHRLLKSLKHESNKRALLKIKILSLFKV